MSQMGRNARNPLLVAAATLAKAGISADSAKLTQSTLRLEVPVIAGRTQYKFPIKTTETFINQAMFSTERRLASTDAFFADQIGLFIGMAASATDGAFELQTFNNTAVGVVVPQEYNKIYNGGLTLTINNNVIMPWRDTLQHRVVPETQTATGIKAQFRGTQDGFTPVEPLIVLSGLNEHVLQLELPEAITTPTANSRIVLILRGALAQNVALQAYKPAVQY